VAEVDDPDQLVLAKRWCANFGTCPLRVFTKPHPRTVPAPALVQPELIKIPKDVLLFDKFIALDLRGEVTNFLTGAHQTLALQQTQYAQILYCDKTEQFIFLHKHSGFVTIVPCARGHIAHSGSPIACMAVIGSERLVTAGSDFLIYVWDIPTFDLVGTIPVNSTGIVAIGGSRSLATIVCMNSNRRIFVCSLHELAFEWSFATGIEGSFQHSLLLLENGLIVVSCERVGVSEGKDEASLWFFTLQGVKIGQVELEGKICKIFGMTTKGCETFVVVSLSSKSVAIVNCTDCAQVIILEEKARPEFVTAFDDSRRLIIVSPRHRTNPVIVRF
jgi:hypothetical protein